MLLIRKSTFCQKVTVIRIKKIPFISNLKKPACASKWDVLELATLRYLTEKQLKRISNLSSKRLKGCPSKWSTFKIFHLLKQNVNKNSPELSKLPLKKKARKHNRNKVFIKQFLSKNQRKKKLIEVWKGKFCIFANSVP